MIDEITQNQRKSYHIKNLYLDPNNYRFVDNDNYTFVDDVNLTDESVQKRTRAFIEGKKRENIRDLIDSFKANGFLDVDVIQVKEISPNQFLVLEGNRRVTALKALQDDFEHDLSIGKLDPKIFKSVPFEIHANEEKSKHRIIMGLKHISGNKTWPPINQAQLIYDYLLPFWETSEYFDEEENLCKSLGVTKQWLRVSQRAYHLILQYKKSDYSDQFASDMYSVFVEIVKKPAIKEWIGWDDSSFIAGNKTNTERLFSWISKVEVENEDGEIKLEDPIVSKATEIRELANFIENEKALQEMEDTRSLARGLAKSGIVEKETYKKSLNDIVQNIEQLNRFKDLITKEELEELKKYQSSFSNLFPKSQSISILVEDYTTCFKAGVVKHFDYISIPQYKVFKNFEIKNLNKINIFAGFNNSGKTTLLEAIYLLTKQNEIGSYFEMIRLRNKLDSLNAKWLNDYAEESTIIEGNFNNTTTKLHIQKFEAQGIDKEDDYIKSYRFNSQIDGTNLESIVHTFGENDIRRYYDKVEILCSSLFKSPYFYNHDEIIKTYTKTLELKLDSAFAVEKVIEFVKKIDSNIKDIRLGKKSDLERFYIDAANFPSSSPDITNYGEGLQRIWEIALAFAYAKNGVICIDEFETAVHYSLLLEFTKFIQELADIFNVQVFITTHSKECIGAFIENNYSNDGISFFTLARDKNETIQYIYYDAESLKNELDQELEVRGW